MTKADLLAERLDDFLAVSPDVEAAAVVSADGLPMASALPPYVEEDRLAAMSAALLTLGERAASGLGRGELAQVFVEADQGYVVLMAAGPNAVLVAVTSGTAKIGLVLFEMRRAAANVTTIMDRDFTHDHVEREMMDEVSSVMADHDGDSGESMSSQPVPPAPPAESAISTWH